MFNDFINSFMSKATLHANSPAIIFNEKSISYQELNQKSNDMSQQIMKHGVTRETIIPLILDRDSDTIICMIAVLKAGCAFLPISPITPCARIQFILEDTDATLVISNINLDHIVKSNIKIIKPSETTTSNDVAPTCIAENQLAYVMYTSGSTGLPKGVMIEHGSMMNLFSSLISELNLVDNEQCLALTDYTFDISLIELLMPLLCGATILLTEQGTVADGVKIRHYLEKYNISFMQATPLSWEILLKQGWRNEGRMRILVGGEQFKTRLAQALDHQKTNVWNMYGPTETSMWSMFNYLTSPLTTESVPLGVPLSNTTICVLDPQLNKVGIGVEGEVYIGGDGLARGYLNNQALTDEKFIVHPQTNERLYKTGDLVINHGTDILCYVRRVDDQLKFGGIRIEAGEIESVIEQEPFVKKAIVKVHETEGYYKSLAAYIEIDEDILYSNGIYEQNTDTSCFLKSIYDETYVHAEHYEHGTINNCGWQSSFTGQLLGVEELDESYQFIRKIINQSDLTEVLEVGCGTGALLLEYIDRAAHCTVFEISSKAIDYVHHKLNEHQKTNIEFINESVINLHHHQRYTCVIVNSVIQYLPSIESLINTLSKLVNATKSNGTVIIGDVRSLELMDVYLLEKLRTNSANETELCANLNSFYYKSRDTEIVLSPQFFHALKKSLKRISYVDISVKHGRFVNELNYFRYDVILHIDKPVLYQSPININYHDALDAKSLGELIRSKSHDSITLCKIPNVYVQSFLKTLDREIPHHPSLPMSKNTTQISAETTKNIELLIDFKPESHEKFVIYEAGNPLNLLDIHFHPTLDHTIMRHPDTHQYQTLRAYSREPFNPWLQKYYFNHIKRLVSQHVVSWVNPSVYVWIEKWPLSISGKLDKKKLQLPLYVGDGRAQTSTLEQLQTIWRNITGDNALAHKEFWVHGISSLCMYFFLATINETFPVNINYHEFRDYNTLDRLADYIEQLIQCSSA